MMSDITHGDLVVCINDETPGGLPLPARAPRKGAICRVTGSALYGDYEMTGGLAHGINLLGYDPSPYLSFRAVFFRKIRPADEEFTAEMRAMRGIVVEA